MTEEQKKDMYVLVELSYIQKKGRDTLKDNSDLFPYDWYLSRDYELKAEILAEAINENKSITEIDNYQLLIEGVRNK